MNSFGMAPAGIFLLFSLASAQFVPGPEPTCLEPMASGGNDYLPHEKYCQLFYRCVSSVRYLFDCGNEQLHDNSSNTCGHLGTSVCRNWPCGVSNNGTNYPHTCSDKYLQCIGTGFMMKSCSSDQHFDTATGTCVAGAGVDHEKCSRSVKNNSATCLDKPDPAGDVCKYITVDGNITHTDRPCPAKTSFNASTCGCTTLDDNCPKTVTKKSNKLPDTACRESMLVTFDLTFTNTGAIRAYSNKISEALNESIQATGVMVSNGVATLSSTATTKAMLYLYYFNFNELTRNTGFVITFRSTAATTSPIYLFATNYMDSCAPTLNVTATLTGTTYSVTAYARFMTRNSQTNITYTEDTITTSVAVAQPASYVKVIVTHDTMLRLKLTDQGTSGTTPGTTASATGTVYLGAAPTYAYNKCGLTVAGGLTGDIAEPIMTATLTQADLMWVKDNCFTQKAFRM